MGTGRFDLACYSFALVIPLTLSIAKTWNQKLRDIAEISIYFKIAYITIDIFLYAVYTLSFIASITFHILLSHVM